MGHVHPRDHPDFARLIIWGYVQKTVRPKVTQEAPSLIEQIAKLFDALGNFLDLTRRCGPEDFWCSWASA
jgi:hypothetical protein